MNRTHPLVSLFYQGVSRLLPVAERLRLTPDGLSWLGLAMNVLAAALFAVNPPGGALMLLAAGLCDVLDGMLARRRELTSRAGAFLDSVLDRYGETVVLAGVWVYLHRSGGGGAMAALVVLAALSGSLMVSYARARGEGLGFSCKGGFFQRPERVLLLAAGGFLEQLAPGWGLYAILILLALGANITAATRFRLILRALREREAEEPENT